MRIQPIVEGAGETEALPELLRRLRDASGAYALTFNKPLRRKRSELVNETPLRKAVGLALRQGCEGILILFDSDKDCPRVVAPQVQTWARSEAPGVRCEVVLAHCEYEAWFLGSLESLRGRRGLSGDAISLADPESVRGAKERLQAMGELRRYAPTRDQAALTALFDLAAAYRSCRSFRRMVRAFGLLAEGVGVPLTDWPPPSWLTAP
ncbi:MAG TPA: DUF4276 family protein [Thermoanaerobaculia bacterium]|nr:DUF4276 family protein [Thermoanaerobaculia bacterium]